MCEGVGIGPPGPPGPRSRRRVIPRRRRVISSQFEAATRHWKARIVPSISGKRRGSGGTGGNEVRAQVIWRLGAARLRSGVYVYDIKTAQKSAPAPTMDADLIGSRNIAKYRKMSSPMHDIHASGGRSQRGNGPELVSAVRFEKNDGSKHERRKYIFQLNKSFNLDKLSHSATEKRH